MSMSPNYQIVPDDGLLLPGLDGANPLGFLAALGLFRVLEGSPGQSDLRMGWAASGGTWIPVLYPSSGVALDEEQILTILIERLATSISDHPVSILDELGKFADHVQLRRGLMRSVADGDDRIRMEWLAAFASDVAPSDSINQLQITRKDYFYKNLKMVIERTESGHLRRTIFHPWDYADALETQSLHLDPSEDRRHAYRWNQPEGDPNRKRNGGMLGANRLAIEAIPLFPSFPEANTLRTVGFTGNRSTNTRWTWPIWSARLSLPSIRSVIAWELLQKQKLDAKDSALLRARGISAAFRTHRILVNKTPNLTPAQCIA